MTQHTTVPAGTHPLSAADRGSLWFLLAIGAAVAIAGFTFSVMRIFELLLGESVKVPADISTSYAPTFMGDGGVSAPMTIDSATFTLTELPASAVVAGIIQTALIIVVTLGIGISIALLARNMLRGHVFTRGNTVALVVAWTLGVVALVAQPFLQWITATSALQAAGFDTAGLVAMTFSPLPFIALIILAAITTHAFSVGTKIQRETEGLV